MKEQAKACYITVENGSKMKQKLNISNTNPRGRIKKNARDEKAQDIGSPHKSTDVMACIFHVWEPKLQQRKTNLGEESILTEEKNDKML